MMRSVHCKWDHQVGSTGSFLLCHPHCHLTPSPPGRNAGDVRSGKHRYIADHYCWFPDCLQWMACYICVGSPHDADPWKIRFLHHIGNLHVYRGFQMQTCTLRHMESDGDSGRKKLACFSLFSPFYVHCRQIPKEGCYFD